MPARSHMEEIAPGVFVEFDYEGANCGLVLTDEGAIVVDTPIIPAEGKAWAAQVAQITDNILFVFNTDHHRAHILGNQYFRAPVMAHEFAWKEMANYKDTFIERTKNLFKKQPDIQRQFNQTRIIKPELTFTGRLIMKKGGRELHFLHLGGHSPATSGLYLPDANILFAGDLVVVNEHPALGQCDSEEWLEQLAWLRDQQLDAIVPGHGPLCNVEATIPVSQYIRIMRVKVRNQYLQGRTKAESAVVISQMIDLFPYKPGRKSMIEKRIRAGVSRIYDEMKLLYGPEEARLTAISRLRPQAKTPAQKPQRIPLSKI
ncbi:MAG: MBL fold metallo-hydrolase [Caldilineae bacterium]|nr:MAG: MBL fold metallo-hydrolase [Caldilineae bacterium]